MPKKGYIGSSGVELKNKSVRQWVTNNSAFTSNIGTISKTSSGAVQVTITEDSTDDTQNVYAMSYRNTSTQNMDHIYYTVFEVCEAVGNVGQLQVSIGGYVYKNMSHRADGTYYSYAIRSKPASANHYSVIVSTKGYRVGDTFTINIVCYCDLSYEYGVGKEPTKEECSSSIASTYTGRARSINKMYIGVDGIARKIVKGYVGVNNIAQCFLSKVNDTSFTTCPFPTTWSSSYYYSDMYKADSYGTWTCECNDLYSNNSSNGVSNAFDNSTTTYYRTDDTGAEQWIEIRCPDGVTIKPNQLELRYQYCGTNSRLQGLTNDDTWIDLFYLGNSTSVTTSTPSLNSSQFFKGFRIYIYEYSSTYDSAYIYTFKVTSGVIRQAIT